MISVANSAVSNSSAVSEDCLDKAISRFVNAYAQQAYEELFGDGETEYTPYIPDYSKARPLHNCDDDDFSELSSQEQFEVYLKIIGKVPGDVVWVTVNQPKKDRKTGDTYDKPLPHKCKIRDDYSLWIVPQQKTYKNGEVIKDGTTNIWRDMSRGFAGTIDYFNDGVKDGFWHTIYIKPNKLEGGMGVKHFVSARSQFFEIDTIKDKEEQLKVVENIWLLTGLEISSIFSGNESVHNYITYFEDLTDEDRWKKIQQMLILLAKSDPAIVNVDRSMRPAGSVRKKDDGSNVDCPLEHVASSMYSPEYVYERLADAFLEVYELDVTKLSNKEWTNLWKRVSSLVDSLEVSRDKLKEILHEPEKAKSVKSENQELSTEQKEIIRGKISKKGRYYPVQSFLMPDCRDMIASPIPVGQGHKTLLHIAGRLRQVENICEENDIPIEPGEAFSLLELACSHYEDVETKGAEYYWNEAEQWAENNPYYGGLDRALRVVAFVNGMSGYSNDPTEDGEKAPEDIKAERDKRNDALYAELTALGKYEHEGVSYEYTDYDRHSYPKTKNHIKPGAINVLVAFTGAGKSQVCKELAMECENVLALTPLIALGRSFAGKEMQCDYHTDNHKYSNSEQWRVISPYKSAHKSPVYTLVPKSKGANSLLINDEFCQALSQILGNMSAKSIYKPFERQGTINHIVDLAKTVVDTNGYVVFMSADWMDIHTKFLRKIIPAHIKINVIINRHIPKRPKINFYTEEKPQGILLKFQDTFYESWDDKTGKFKHGTLLLSSARTGQAGSINAATALKNKYKHLQDYIVEANGKNKEQGENLEFFANPNEQILKYGAVCFSNVVVNGISITTDYAKSTFVLENGIGSPEDVHQKIMRSRTADDLHVWTAKQFNRNGGCPYVDPEHVKNYLLNRWKSNSKLHEEYLAGLNIKYNAKKQNFDSPEFELFCELAAIRNLNSRDLRKRTKQYLQKWGFEVIDTTADYSDDAMEALKDKNKAADFEREVTEAKAVANAEDLDDDTIKACKQDPDYMYEVIKYFLRKWYPAKFIEECGNLELTHPTTKETTKLEGIAGIYILHCKQNLAAKFRRAYSVLHESIDSVISKDLKDDIDTLNDFKYNFVAKKLMPQDFSTNSVEIQTLKNLKIDELIPKLEKEGCSATENNKAVADFCLHVKATKNVKAKLKINISEKTSDKIILNQILEERLGLPVKRERNGRGDRSYQYFIHPEVLCQLHSFCEALAEEQANKKAQSFESLAEQVTTLS
ncbi:MAG TPA: hypothetical protein V6D14_06690 [Coleofasciculaceae cyanobacterium]|jgi:hypothetical protein